MAYRNHLLLCLAVAALAGAGAVRAEDAYLANRTFEIPFSLNPGRPIKQVILHASTDGKKYSQHAIVQPTSTHFDFHAAADGWHYFVVQTEDNAGTREPPDPAKAAPSLRVCVDTARPTVEKFHAVQSDEEGKVAVEWIVSDTNLDLRTLKLAYRAGDGPWVTLNPDRLDRAHFKWKPTGAAPYDVRLQIADLAGNLSSAAVKLGGDEPVGKASPEGGGAARADAPNVVHVRSKAFKLNYDVTHPGRSGIKTVEVWTTKPDKRSWTRLATDAQEKGPYEIKVLSEGRYGYTLRPVSGVGRGPRPPSIGQDPQVWIEVDETPPSVRVTEVKLDGTEGGTLTVRYLATDKFLRARPITVLQSEKRDGPWTPIREQENLENKGVAKFGVKDMPFEFFVKVVAMDEAGNEGWAIWTDSVKNDPNDPVIKINGVEASPTAPAPGTPRPESPIDSQYRAAPITVTPSAPPAPAPAPVPAAPAYVPAPAPAPVAPPAPMPAPLPGSGPPGSVPPLGGPPGAVAPPGGPPGAVPPPPPGLDNVPGLPGL